MIIVILQARMSSSRFPGKVLQDISGQPLLVQQIKRIQRATQIDQLVVATSDELSDDPIATVCQGINCAVYRGSLTDVLDRYYQASRHFNATQVVRLTADCPLTSPQIIDAVIEQHVTEKNDYTSNCVERTFPDGLDVEVMTFAALAEAWQRAETTREREHVSGYIRAQPHARLGHYKDNVDRSDWRWTVDYPADLAFVRAVYQKLYPSNPDFSWQEVVNLLQQHPELAAINRAQAVDSG